jgi:hypothetical protein
MPGGGWKASAVDNWAGCGQPRRQEAIFAAPVVPPDEDDAEDDEPESFDGEDEDDDEDDDEEEDDSDGLASEDLLSDALLSEALPSDDLPSADDEAVAALSLSSDRLSVR